MSSLQIMKRYINCFNSFSFDFCARPDSESSPTENLGQVRMQDSEAYDMMCIYMTKII